MSAFGIELALLLLALFTVPGEVRSSSRLGAVVVLLTPVVLALAAVAIWIVDRCVP